jgi:DNA-binding PadR family transcriptional regulator
MPILVPMHIPYSTKPIYPHKNQIGLKDLCNKNCLQIYNEETGGEKVIIKYRITQKGKDVVHQYRKSFIHEIFGSVEDLFETKL